MLRNNMKVDIFIEICNIEFSKLNITGWISRNGIEKCSRLFEEFDYIKVSFYDRPDLAEANVDGVGLTLKIELSYIYLHPNSLNQFIETDIVTVVCSREMLFVKSFLDDKFDFVLSIQNPSTHVESAEMRFLAALLTINKKTNIIEKGMAATILIYRALEFNWDLSLIAHDIRIDFQNIAFNLESVRNGSGNRWLICLLQALVIYLIKYDMFDEAYDLASRVKGGCLNVNYPSLSTNCLYLIHYCLFYEKIRKIPLDMDYAVLAKKIYTIHFDCVLDPGDHFNELLNSLVIFKIIAELEKNIDNKNIDCLIERNILTRNWTFVQKEMVLFAQNCGSDSSESN